jgi:folate-dependent tRNA-U54 methylase TrmFO/GidA
MQAESIKSDALIDIKIGVAFYKDLQESMYYLVNQHTDEELQQLADKLNNGQDQNLEDWEKAVQAVMLLCTEIEERAREQGKTEMVEIPD